MDLPVQTPKQIARQFGCTEQQARDQLLANAKQMDSMAQRAEDTNRKYCGYTAEYLRSRAQEYRDAAGVAEVAQ